MKSQKNNIIAVHGIYNTLSLAITDIIYGINDKATTVFINSDGERLSQYTSIIHYDMDGNDYIKRYGRKYYLNDFLRTNI